MSKNNHTDKNLQQQDKCLTCKIISYCVTLGFTFYGFSNIRRQPIPGSIISVIGLLGLSILACRDIR